jgi:diguanylate cyclase (GGDEF)-like protein
MRMAADPAREEPLAASSLDEAERLIVTESRLAPLLAAIVGAHIASVLAIGWLSGRLGWLLRAVGLDPVSERRLAGGVAAAVAVALLVCVIVWVRRLHLDHHSAIATVARLHVTLRAALAQLETRRDSESAAQEELKDVWELARTDPLTGLANRRCFESRVTEELDRARRYGGTFSLAMLDVDHFKRFNDARGHQAGDSALQEIARLLQSAVRQSDIVGRYGGEEFCLLLLMVDEAVAKEVCERIRHTVAARMMELEPECPLTISIGVASHPGDGKDLTELVGAADQALYRAKDQGRNQVCTSAWSR